MSRKLLAGLGLAIGLFAAPAFGDSIKIAFIDPLSDPAAAVGEGGLRQFRYAAEQINRQGGANDKTLQIVPYDNNNNPQESSQQPSVRSMMVPALLSRAIVRRLALRCPILCSGTIGEIQTEKSSISTIWRTIQS